MPKASLTSRRSNLEGYIYYFSQEMLLPCSRCKHSGHYCLILLDSSCYLDCIDSNSKYDLVITTKDYKSFSLTYAISTRLAYRFQYLMSYSRLLILYSYVISTIQIKVLSISYLKKVLLVPYILSLIASYSSNYYSINLSPTKKSFRGKVK